MLLLWLKPLPVAPLLTATGFFVPYPLHYSISFQFSHFFHWIFPWFLCLSCSFSSSSLFFFFFFFFFLFFFPFPFSFSLFLFSFSYSFSFFYFLFLFFFPFPFFFFLPLFSFLFSFPFFLISSCYLIFIVNIPYSQSGITHLLFYNPDYCSFLPVFSRISAPSHLYAITDIADFFCFPFFNI